MVVLSVGLLVGYQLNRQQTSINVAPQAQEQPNQPTPIDLGHNGGRWFTGSNGLICAADFGCNTDPIINKLEIRSLDGQNIMALGVDVTGRAAPEGTPVGKGITGSCSSRGAFGIAVDWDLRKAPDTSGVIERMTGYAPKQGQIVVSMRQSGPERNYFIYDRPAWLTGSEDALVYLYFDAKTGGTTRRYIQTSLGKKGCGPDITPVTITPSTATPSVATPSVPIPTVTLIPTSSPTPVIVAGCFEACSPSTTCGKDPFTSKPMGCYQITNGGGPPRTPTRVVDGNQNQDNLFDVLGPCASDSDRCLCLPFKCVENNASCQDKESACTNVKTTPTPPDTSPTPTPPPQVCTFNALAYVQECTELDETGQCKRGNEGRFLAKPMASESLTTTWGASNNKQVAGGRYGNNPATPFQYQNSAVAGAFQGLYQTFPYLAKIGVTEMSLLRYDARLDLSFDKNPLERGSGTDLTEEGRKKNPILINPLGTYPNEQYYNFENAHVKLFADFAHKAYRVVPEGNEIAHCSNTISGTDIGACDLVEYQSKRVDQSLNPSDPKLDRDPRDTIHGLTVGCGQNIVYGWTLQKCNDEPADYLFVIDVSTSMTNTTDISGKLKINAARDALERFLNNVKLYSKDSRVALVQFSSKSNTRELRNFTNNIDDVTNAVRKELHTEVGTCIECGLDKAIETLEKRPDKSRKTFVIVLTDGLPNSDPGHNPTNPTPEQSKSLIKQDGDTLRNLGVTVMGIGVGDPAKADASDPAKLIGAELIEVIKLFTTSESLAYSTKAGISTEDIFASIQTKLNSCARAEFKYNAFLNAMDINGDGVINTIDLFLIYDNYFARGQNVPEDLNGDQVVNSLDVSIIVNNIGKTILQENNTAQKTLGDLF